MPLCFSLSAHALNVYGCKLWCYCFIFGLSPFIVDAWGQAVVNLYKKFSKYPVHPIVNVLNGNTAIPDLPAVNHYIRNEDAAKIAKVLYHEAIEDGSFWDHEEVVADFFGDLENPQSLFHILLDGSGDEEVEHNIVN